MGLFLVGLFLILDVEQKRNDGATGLWIERGRGDGHPGVDGGCAALDFRVQPCAGGLRPNWPTVALQSCLTARGR